MAYHEDVFLFLSAAAVDRFTTTQDKAAFIAAIELIHDARVRSGAPYDLSPRERTALGMALGMASEMVSNQKARRIDPVCEACGHECAEDCTNCAGMKPGGKVCSICARGRA